MLCNNVDNCQDGSGNEPKNLSLAYHDFVILFVYNSDERICSEGCPPGKFQCPVNKRCIPVN
jgi:hypothetical protein